MQQRMGPCAAAQEADINASAPMTANLLILLIDFM
jgi:hypothetical protein